MVRTQPCPQVSDLVFAQLSVRLGPFGMEHFTFHDMRHTGQTLAAATGATLKDLMKRMGHAWTVAAYRYIHAVEGRDAEIASALSEIAAHGSSARLPKTIVAKG